MSHILSISAQHAQMFCMLCRYSIGILRIRSISNAINIVHSAQNVLYRKVRIIPEGTFDGTVTSVFSAEITKRFGCLSSHTPFLHWFAAPVIHSPP